jgi:hypothetical protein
MNGNILGGVECFDCFREILREKDEFFELNTRPFRQEVGGFIYIKKKNKNLNGPPLKFVHNMYMSTIFQN